MFRRLARWMGFHVCDHEFTHIGNVIMPSGPHHTQCCFKCFKLRYKAWS